MLPGSCALASQAAAEQPTGWAIAGRRFLLVEVPLPWPPAIADAAGLPPGLRDLILAQPDDHDPYVEAVVPDPDWSMPGCTRFIGFDRDPSVPSRLLRTEVIAPTGEATGAIGAWLTGDGAIGSDVAASSIRDVLVCTHGSHDACCGRFGAPLYARLRAGAPADVRVWRGSHTGGHRFAPTMLELPGGRSWGRLDADTALALMSRDGETADLRDHYRGLGTLETFYERLVEAELLFRTGWTWLERGLSGEVVEGHRFAYPEEPDELDDRAVVHLTERGTSGEPIRVWEGVVERRDDRLTRGECGDEPWSSPIYAVTSLEAIG